MSCTHGFVLRSDWYHQVRHRKSKILPTDVTRLSPPPVLRRELGNEASISMVSLSVVLILWYCVAHLNTLIQCYILNLQVSS